jgi:translation initiation factor 1
MSTDASGPVSPTREKQTVGRGKKLDLAIGASFDEGWQEVEEAETAQAEERLAPGKHQLVFKKEKRRGKPVTLTGPFSLEKKEAADLLKVLKKKLGCGGAFKEGWMEFQGDLQQKLRALLEAEGYRFKRK